MSAARRADPGVLARAVTIGVIVGAVIGGVVGTGLLILVGTIIGAIVGSIVGGIIGLINGFVLMGVTKLTTARWAAATAGAVITGVCSTGFVWLFFFSHASPSYHPLGLVIVAVCTALGALLGPVAARGAQPVDLGPPYGPRPVSTIVGVTIAIGAGGGIAIGGLAGLVDALGSHQSNVVDIVTSGAIIGAVIGVIPAMVVLVVMVGPRLRVRP